MAKVTITIPSEVYKKLEEDRGLIPRATYIQMLIKERGVINPLTGQSRVEKSVKACKHTWNEEWECIWCGEKLDNLKEE